MYHYPDGVQYILTGKAGGFSVWRAKKLGIPLNEPP